MAGFKEQQFRIDGTKYPDVGEETQAPSVNVTPYKPTPAYTQDNGGQSLQALGDTLGAFFNGLGQTAKQIGDVNAYAERVSIERENENLKLQGGIDYRAGRPMAPEYANRQAYAGAYQNAAAENHAFELTEGFKDVLSKLPRDGSQDVMGAAKQYYKDQIGSGTGDRDYDARLMGLFTQQVQPLVAQADEQKRQDQERSATDTIIQSVSNTIQTQNGITPGQVADTLGKLMTATHGDVQAANRLLESIVGSVQNERQAKSFMNALGGLPAGEDSDGKPIKWKERNSAAYLRMSERAFEQTNRTKTLQAAEEVSQWQLDFEALKHDTEATGPDWARMGARMVDIRQRHGTGLDHLLRWEDAYGNWATKQAGVNVMINAIAGSEGGSHQLAVYEAKFGKQNTDAMSNAAYVWAAKNVPGLEALEESTRQSGGRVINPQHSDEAMRQAARLFTRPELIEAHQGKYMSADAKFAMFGALTGPDPDRAARSFMGAKLMEQGLGGLPSGLLTTDQETMYRAMSTYTLDGTDAVTAFRAMHEDARFREVMAKADQTGKVDAAEIAGKTGQAAAALRHKLDEGISEFVRTSSGMSTIPGFRANVGMAPDVRAVIDAMLAKNAVIQRANGEEFDPDKAVKDVTATLSNRFLVLPSFAGVRVIENRFGPRGRTAGTPLNDHGPLSVSMGFPPIYAGVPMVNSLGKLENPRDNFAGDLEALSKALPGINSGHGLDTHAATLSDPDEYGLMMLKQRNGMPIRIAPGETINVPVTVKRPDWNHGGTKDVEAIGDFKLPADFNDAHRALQDRLPPGWFAVPNGMKGDDGYPSFVLHYGFRLKGDLKAANRNAMAAEFQRDADNAATNRRLELKKGYTTEGGAAMGITPSQRGRPAVAGVPEQADPIGDWMRNNGGPASGRTGIGGFN